MTLERNVLKSMLPLSLSQNQLNDFNQFWQNLDTEDRQKLQNIIERAKSETNSREPGYLAYHTWLLALMSEGLKEIKDLTRELEALREDQVA